MKGFWRLDVTGVDELSDCSKEHIAELIKQGFTEGEVIEENEEISD